MSRSSRSQNADAGPSQSRRRANGFADSQRSTQDDESLRKPVLSDEEDDDPRQRWTIDTFENVPVDPQRFVQLVSFDSPRDS